MIKTMSAAQLRLAADIKDSMDKLAAQLESLENGSTISAPKNSARGKYVRSAATIKKLALAQKRRWAAVKKA